MGMDNDFVVAQSKIVDLETLLRDLPYGQRSGIANDIVAFVNTALKKYNKK
jgi:hypothetical protein